MLAETSSPSAHPRRKTGDSVLLLQLLLSDKCSCTAQELLFFLGIAGLQRQDCPSDGQSMNHQEPWKICKACPNLFFLWGPSAPFSKRPVCGDPKLQIPFATADARKQAIFKCVCQWATDRRVSLKETPLSHACLEHVSPH